ncbi:hypothetical protein OAG63_01850 [Methylacidiphilales bacterium]|nr:hypothetical protein [Candidatus Methylacidiphilales bacterium]
MKIQFAFAAILAVVIMAFSPTLVRAQMEDITVNNGNGTSESDYSAITGQNTNPDPRPGVFALGNVNLGDTPTKEWDLEAFGYDSSTSTLTYVGGFNPTVPINDSGTNYSLGDIFLSPNNAVIPQTGSGIVTGANTPYTNPGYTYAIHFSEASPTSLNYSIYQLTNTTQVLTVGGQPGVNDNNFNNNGQSDPYALNLAYDLAQGNITQISSGTTTVLADDNAAINGLLGESLFDPSTVGAPTNTLADNYVASFDLSSLGLTGFNASLTEQCGNDLLKGSTLSLSATPEPKSIYLALAAAALFLYVLRLLRYNKLQA